MLASAIIGSYVRQLWTGQRTLSTALQSAARADLEAKKNIEALQAWANSHAQFAADLNKRLVTLETENKDIVPKKKDNDDPYSGPRSWSAQAAAAERAAGVREMVDA